MLQFSAPVTAFFDTSLHVSKTKHGFHRYHIISYRIVDLKWQNHLKVRTNKPKLKVKMQWEKLGFHSVILVAWVWLC